jgi:hypothetical protein
MDQNQNEDKNQNIAVDEITKSNQDFLNQFEEKNSEKKPKDRKT